MDFKGFMFKVAIIIISPFAILELYYSNRDKGYTRKVSFDRAIKGYP